VHKSVSCSMAVALLLPQWQDTGTVYHIVYGAYGAACRAQVRHCTTVHSSKHAYC
jgi:hypothetical protein